MDVSEKGKDVNLLTFCNIRQDDTASPPQVAFSLSIRNDFSWTVHFCGKELDTRTCSVLTSASPCLDCVSRVLTVVEALEGSKVCIANPDEKFLPLLMSRKNGFTDSTGMYIVIKVNLCCVSSTFPFCNRHQDGCILRCAAGCMLHHTPL